MSSEQEQWVCGVRSSRNCEDVIELESKLEHLMLDSGSQSTACRPSFAPDYEVDDTEKAKLCDIQDQQIESYGKKILDVRPTGDDKQEDIPCSFSMDVSDVGKDVASMSRMLRHALHGEGSQVLDGARRKAVQDR